MLTTNSVRPCRHYYDSNGNNVSIDQDWITSVIEGSAYHRKIVTENQLFLGTSRRLRSRPRKWLYRKDPKGEQ